MIACPECGGDTIAGPGTVTAMGWTPHFDDDVRLHSHDPNWHKYRIRCARGHAYLVKQRYGCPVQGCDYGTIEYTKIEPRPAPIQGGDLTYARGNSTWE